MDPRWAEELLLRAEMAGTDLLSMTQTLSDAPPFDEAPGCILSPIGRYLAPVPYRPTGLDDTKFEPANTISQAIELAYQDSLKGQEKRGQKKVLEKTLKRAVKTASIKRDRIKQDLDAALKADDLEKMGSLILSQPQSIQQGESSVEVNNLFDTKSSTITIPLDPDLSATENGHAFLKRAAKLKKSAPVLERRLLQTEDTVNELETLRIELESVVEEEAIDAFRNELVNRGLVRPRQVRSKPKNVDSSDLHPRKYKTSDGWEVWVGRNDQENDRMTKSVPRHALWFHAHGCPGSHVVLRPRDKRDPSPEALNDAASLAAYWSKARGSKFVPVNYTEARHVQKPRGAPAGLVTIQKEKTLFVQPREIEKWDTTE
jgi:predicted ribosome quality control (RQC) complex YloA/Tae2 family protein